MDIVSPLWATRLIPLYIEGYKTASVIGYCTVVSVSSLNEPFMSPWSYIVRAKCIIIGDVMQLAPPLYETSSMKPRRYSTVCSHRNRIRK